MILAVRPDNGPELTSQQWEALEDLSIYLPIWDELESRQIRQADDRILVLVWNSKADLVVGNQPVLVRCHLSTQNPSASSAIGGSNQASDPIVGFSAVLNDEDQRKARQKGESLYDMSARLWSGRFVEYYNFEYPTTRTDSSTVDAGVQPTYQFLLEVDQVILPEDGHWKGNPRRVWSRESFAVAKSKDDARVERIPGYHVTADLAEEIRESLSESSTWI